MTQTAPTHPAAPTVGRPAVPPLLLASASPRRRELLAFLGVSYAVHATDAEERDTPTPAEVLGALPPLDLALDLHPVLRAWRKAVDVAAGAPAAAVLGADTIVALDRDVLNKPRNPAEAQMMLAQLSGRTHTVYTGLCVIWPDDGAPAPSAAFVSAGRRLYFALAASVVTIAPLSAAAIAAYVATGEPLDKAGAYGIQGLGGRLVQGVDGSYTNVVGLPLVETSTLLRATGQTDLVAPDEAYRRWLAYQEKEPLPCPPTQP